MKSCLVSIQQYCIIRASTAPLKTTKLVDGFSVLLSRCQDQRDSYHEHLLRFAKSDLSIAKARRFVVVSLVWLFSDDSAGNAVTNRHDVPTDNHNDCSITIHSVGAVLLLSKMGCSLIFSNACHSMMILSYCCQINRTR